jgi:hypothetical protein
MPTIDFDHQLVWNFLDRFGKWYASTPMTRKMLHRGKPGKCFANARAFSNCDRENVRYIEGMAGNSKTGTLHAWNVIKPGFVRWIKADVAVDCTWAVPLQMWHPFYCGVDFDLEFSKDIIVRQRRAMGWPDEGKSPDPKHGGFSVLTYEPLLLGKVAPYEF